jgi:hypothetical protein
VTRWLAALLALIAAQAMASVCVTSGNPSRAGETIRVDDAIVRMVWKDQRGSYAGMVFTWGGPSTASEVPAASGTVLRQLGLLLYAHDPCNSVYVMWHEGERRLRVVRKRNPGMTTSGQCGAKGYATLLPDFERDVPKLAVGARHWFEARIADDGEMGVRVNGVMVWHGMVPASARALGPAVAGFRSDNAKFEFAWLGGPAGGGSVHQCQRQL